MRLKKAKALIMAGVMALTAVMAVPVTANAAHFVPNGGGRQCNNSYGTYVDVAVTHSYVTPHRLSDGRSCNMTRMSYTHDKICSACGGTIESGYIKECTETHSICETYKHTCNE